MKRLWRWFTLADVQETSAQEHVGSGHTSMWFTMTSYADRERVEYSACCGEHLLQSLKSMGYEGLK